MPNVILTPQMYAKLMLMELGDPQYLHVIRNLMPDFTPEFGKKGYKIGDTLSVRKPQRFTVSNGMPYDPQAITNIRVPLKVDKFNQIAYEWDSVEKTLFLNEAMELYVRPACSGLSNTINAQAAQYVAQNTFNCAGAPGTVPTDFDTYTSAEDMLIEQGLGQNEDLVCVINRKMSSKFVGASRALFNDVPIISTQQKEGRIVNQLGYRFEIDQTIYAQTTGGYNNVPAINGANQSSTTGDGNNGTMSLLLSGFTASTGTVNYGDKFQIVGVYAVHPQTRASTGRLQWFTVLSPGTTTADVSGNMTLLVAPGMTPSGQYQNVSALPATGAQVLFWGAAAATPLSYASLTTLQALVIHKQSFAFLSVPLNDPDPGMGVIVSSQKEPSTGLVLSVMRGFDPVKRIEINRIDTLWGIGPLYREAACVICGS